MEDVTYFISFDPATRRENTDTDYGDDFLEYNFNEERAHPVWKRRLLKTKSPVPLPQSKVTCAKWCYPWPGAKICCGHKYEWRYYWIEVSLEVSLKSPQDIKNEIEDCLRTSAIITAIVAVSAAIASGGAALGAALTTFEKVMYACISAKLGSEIISVTATSQGYWGDWE